jgi:hypothetical protein
MDRSIAVGNRICARRLEKQRQARHREKLSSIRPNIDNGLPASSHLTHLRVNYKRDQLTEDRCTEIDRANRILLRRMSDIIRKPSTDFPVGSISNSTTSLNRDSRRKELQRITNENMGILKRIERVQPMYDHVKWEQDFRRTRKFMENKCELPVVLNNSQSTNTLRPSSAPESSLASSRSSCSDYRDIDLPDNRKILLKTGRRLCDKFYLVEISTDGGALWIQATSTDNDRHLMYLSEPEHEKLFGIVNGDYRGVVNGLRLSRRGKLTVTRVHEN